MANSTSLIRYQYAYDDSNIVDINKLTNADRKDYTCISCGNVLRPAMGAERAWHFRHKSQDIYCSNETYLHKMGKTIFKTTYEECLKDNKPFSIILPRKIYCEACGNRRCDCSSDLISYDLTKYFNSIREEARDDIFIPDLLLTNTKGERVYIEIAVSHFSSERKVSSGTRIIEISLKKEEDFDLIRSRQIKADDEKVSLYNFINPESLRRDLTPGQCLTNATCFHISKNGVASFKTHTLLEYQQLQSSNNGYSTVVDEDLSAKLFLNLITEALSAKQQGIKDCCLCNHRYRKPSSLNMNKQPLIYCKIKKSALMSDAAAECLYYEPHPHNLSKPDPEPSQPITEIKDTAPQAIHQILVDFARGKEKRHCFVCTKRDVSGYQSKPEVLVYCKELGIFNSPEQAKNCQHFEPYTKEEIARKLG